MNRNVIRICLVTAITAALAMDTGRFLMASIETSGTLARIDHWVRGWVDWNIVLDSDGGPNHAGNYCGAPIMIDRKRPKPSAPPPALGSGTDDVLREMGLSPEEIATLRAEGVI